MLALSVITSIPLKLSVTISRHLIVMYEGPRYFSYTLKLLGLASIHMDVLHGSLSMAPVLTEPSAFSNCCANHRSRLPFGAPSMPILATRVFWGGQSCTTYL
jgi:hypothetical protein